jgi:hypothetical protein
MTAESASDRQREWVFVVRRSFGIPDLITDEDARETLIGSLEDQLRDNRWQSPSRAIAEPMVDALIALGTSGDLDERLLRAAPPLSDVTSANRDAAYRLIEKGLTVVDPQHLVFAVMSEYPSEVVATAQQALDRVGHYVREQPLGD